MGFKVSTIKALSQFTPVLLLALSACSTIPNFNPQEESERQEHAKDAAAAATPEKTESQLLHEQVSKLQDRVQDLETRLSAMNDKINLENGVKGAEKAEAPAPVKPPVQAVKVPSAHAKIIPSVNPVSKKAKSEEAVVSHGGFTTDETIDRFREAKILFESKKYSDAVLEFSDFVKAEPEHSLAPAAQYYVAMSYMEQKEYKLAEEELSRGLLAYPHSSYVPDTLLALAQVSDRLNKPSRVTYFKEKILTNFPNSPQAKSLNIDSAKVEAKAEKAPPMSEEEEPSLMEKPTAPKPPTAPMTSKEEPSVEGEKNE